MDSAAQEDTQCHSDITRSPGTHLCFCRYDKCSKGWVFGYFGRFEGTGKSVQRVVWIVVCSRAHSVGAVHGQDNFSVKRSMFHWLNKSQVKAGTFLNNGPPSSAVSSQSQHFSHRTGSLEILSLNSADEFASFPLVLNSYLNTCSCVSPMRV